MKLASGKKLTAIALLVVALGAMSGLLIATRDPGRAPSRAHRLENELARKRNGSVDTSGEQGGRTKDGKSSSGGLDDLFAGAGDGKLAACAGLTDDERRDGQEPGGAKPDLRGRGIAGIARAVSQLRELRFRRPVEPLLLSPRRLKQRVGRIVARQYGEAEAEVDQRILVALGALPRGTDLRRVVRKLAVSQVVGFYDDETKELVVASERPSALAPLEKMALAHELEHALADQAFGLPSTKRRPGKEDSQLAALAVVEGDATLTMMRYASQALSLWDQLSMAIDPALTGADASLSRAPPYLQAQLAFPYAEGLGFVCDRFVDGGWEAIDRLYRRPPATTAQILFPERYEELAEPSDPRDASGPRGWRRRGAQAFGAANLLWLFQAPGGDPDLALTDAKDRVAAWRGGEVSLWTRGDRSALALAVAHDPGRPLCPSVVAWYEAAFADDRRSPSPPGAGATFDGGLQDATVRCSKDEVRVGIGPDLRVAGALAR